MGERSSSYRGPWFCRVMNRADQLILSVPDDAASKLWGVDNGPTNVMIHIEDGRDFNVFLSASKGKLFFFHGWSNVVEHLGLTQGCLVVFNPLDHATFKLTTYQNGVSRGSFWTYMLPPSCNFYLIPECILPKIYDFSSNDVTSTVMIDNQTFNVSIVTNDGKVGFSAVFGKNGVEITYPNLDFYEIEVAPIDVDNEVEEQIHGGVTRFVRTAGEDYFRIPDHVSRMAKLHEGLKDLTIKFLHLDPPLQITNGTRRERRTNGRGYRYTLTSWKKFMKAAQIKVQMEEGAITLLNNLDLNVDNYTIRIRIVRLWTRADFNNARKVYCYDMIVMDSEGTKMQAFVLAKNASGYQHLLEEKRCLTIRNPSLGENRQKVKYAKGGLKINLNNNTVVEECHEAIGSEWGFDFTPFDSVVEDPTVDNKFLKVQLIDTETNNGQNQKKVTFMLEDLNNKQIFVTLWDGYADQIMEYESSNQGEKNVVVIIQFGKYKFWGGHLSVSNLYTVTRVLINSDIDEVAEFKQRFIEKLSPEMSSSYSGLSSSVVKSATKEFLSDLTFFPIGSLSSIDTTRFVVIVGTIKSFASNNEWFYNACTNCNKKVSTVTVVKEKHDGTDGFEEVTVLECKTDICNTRTVSSIPRIRLYIRVQDCTGIVSLTLFEREVTKLLKVNANQLLDNNIELANEGSFPKELNSLLNMKFAFKIAVSSFNITKKSDGYSVSKMTDNPVVLSELDKHFDTIQPIDEEAVNVEPSDSNRNDDLPVKDSISQTGDDVTPCSNVFKVGFTTSFDQKDADFDTSSERDLKRNLDTVYDVDDVSSQSSSKSRKDGGVDAVLLIPKKEK
ncbi:putative transcription factor B3-Domain family [Helianthus annuus]|nr:putative transcription factor B3-Domain family [Helianthus annuus]KAJ0583639.1 putative transcription factor B3-Domain family [Helianthus annuus]KAJ0917834.1 putative transcription factor B3-Domain family [Helianthus annuus]